MNLYMLLIRNEGFPTKSLSESEIKEHTHNWNVWFETLVQLETLEDGFPFSSKTAAIIGNGGRDVSKKLYLESNNVNVGGYVLINAANLEEAIEIAKACPAFENITSTVEVRECVEVMVAV